MEEGGRAGGPGLSRAGASSLPLPWKRLVLLLFSSPLLPLPHVAALVACPAGGGRAPTLATPEQLLFLRLFCSLMQFLAFVDR